MKPFRIDPEITPLVVELIFTGDLVAIDIAFGAHPEWVALAQVYYKPQEADDKQVNANPLKLTLFQLVMKGDKPELVRHLLEVHGFNPHIGIEVAIEARKGEMVTTFAPERMWHMVDVRGDFHNMEYYGKEGRTVWLVDYAEHELYICQDMLRLFRENPDEETDKFIPELEAKLVCLTEIIPVLREFADKAPVPMIPYPFDC